MKCVHNLNSIIVQNYLILASGWWFSTRAPRPLQSDPNV